MEMTNNLLDKKLGETIGHLEKFVAAGANPKALQPMLETVRAAKRRLTQFRADGPDKLTSRDEIALRLLPMIAKTEDIESMDWWKAAIQEAFMAADVFLDVRGEVIAGEF
jgi:hypothetical protein